MDQIENNRDNKSEASEAADLRMTQVSKCPKPFSIESIISSEDNKSEQIAPNYDKVTNSSAFLQSNLPMAAAASLYNPWFHNYFMQQQKVAGNVLEWMQSNPVNQLAFKEKCTEMFDHKRNALSSTPRSTEPFFGHVENAHEMRFNDMIFSANNEYYKHLNGSANSNQLSGNLEQCKIQYSASDDNEAAFQFNKKDKDEVNGFISHFNKSATHDDSPDEMVDDEMESDCNSELSLDMSPDGDNNTQGKRMIPTFN